METYKKKCKRKKKGRLENGKNKKIIAGIAGAVALIAIVAVCIFAFGSGKEKRITENKETTTVAGNNYST